MRGARLTARDSALAQLCVEAAVGEASVDLGAVRMTLCACRDGSLADARKNSGGSGELPALALSFVGAPAASRAGVAVRRGVFQLRRWAESPNGLMEWEA